MVFLTSYCKAWSIVCCNKKITMFTKQCWHGLTPLLEILQNPKHLPSLVDETSQLDQDMGLNKGNRYHLPHTTIF